MFSKTLIDMAGYADKGQVKLVRCPIRLNHVEPAVIATVLPPDHPVSGLLTVESVCCRRLRTI